MMLPSNFSDRFCAHFKYAPSDFDRAVFAMLFYPVWVPLARLLLFLYPSMFKVDFEIIHHVGSARSMKELLIEAENLVRWYQSALFRRTIRFRISGRRVISVGQLLFADEIEARPKQA